MEVVMDKICRLSLLLKQEDVQTVGGCFDFQPRFAYVPCSNFLQFGRESVHLLNHISIHILGGSRHDFAWRWLDFGAYGPPLHRKVCNWMGFVKARWQDGTFMFNFSKWTSWSCYKVCFGLLLICSTFPCTFWHRRPLLGLRKLGCFGAGILLTTKIGSPEHIHEQIDKWFREVVLFVIVDGCGEYSCSVRWNGRELNVYPLTMAYKRGLTDGKRQRERERHTVKRRTEVRGKTEREGDKDAKLLCQGETERKKE